MVSNLNEENFGDYFRRLRRSKGFKAQKDLARASGVSQATLSRIEDGTQKPQPETLKILAKTLDEPYTELMVLAGHWDEEELLHPVDYSKDMEDHQEKDQITTKENSPSYANEKEFVEKIDLSNNDLLKQFKLAVDGRELSEQETKNMIAFVRTLRQND